MQITAELSESHTVKLNELADLGAGDFQHTNGDLLTHLCGTYSQLKKWEATEQLQDAGLFHAAYGTAGFEAAMVGTDAREKIQRVIGTTAEQIVYLYCACDRDFVWQQFADRSTQPPIFRDRFTHKDYAISESLWRSFCELTVANETEIAQHSVEFITRYGDELFQTLTGMSKYLSDTALNEMILMFAKKIPPNPYDEL